MKRIILFGLVGILGLVYGNWTRMNTLLVGDYVDDPVNVGIYPQHLNVFPNIFYGDIFATKTDYAILIRPIEKYGGIGIWQDKNFNIGYGIGVKKIEFGIFGSPVKDHNRLGIGIGYSNFDTRIDFSGIINDEKNVNEGYDFHLRFLKRKAEYVLIPRYALNIQNKPYDYQSHTLGFALQRLILNEGFVILGMEYLLREGDIDVDRAYCFAGFELPLNKTSCLRMGAREEFDEDFTIIAYQIQPGICLKIREFNLDFHLNQSRLFDKDLTFVSSFGLDLNFGRF
jgi:hypothetical protein|uniref:Uncharacterized protein n=1 Tax=candidate division WOR-3 bacterium TaxID=2052148 RepID=A0A7C4TGL6_UNCW3